MSMGPGTPLSPEAAERLRRAFLAGPAPEKPLSHLKHIRLSDRYRNRPCPCGSGKKFKKCCGKP